MCVCVCVVMQRGWLTQHTPNNNNHIRSYHVALLLGEEVTLGVVVAALLAGGALPQVKWVGKQRPGQLQAASLAQTVL